MSDELLDQYKREVADDWDATQDTREAQNEDMRFVTVDGGMWENWLDSTYDDVNGPSRVKMELDITSDYVMRYVGEWTLNRANVTYTPDDAATTDDDAELLNGVYRGDFKENDGQISQDNAILEMALCGVGAFKISTKFVDEEDPENENQEIIWEPIHNAFNHVVWDENAKRIDKADAKRVTVLYGYTNTAFEAEWPDATPSSAYSPETYKGSFNWNNNEQIYVAQRYDVEVVKEKVQVWQNEQLNKVRAYPDSDFPELKDELEALGWEFVRERKIDRRVVSKTVFSGQEILEETKRIAGKYLPIIPVYGYRTYVDGEEHSRGLVRKQKDANRSFNMAVSKTAETSASGSDNKPIVFADQVKGLESFWQNPDMYAYLPIHPVVDGQGNKQFIGQAGELQPKQIDPNTMALMDVVGSYVQRVTGNAPQDTIDPNASGKAINALRARENLNTQVPTDNALQAIKHSGKVYRSIAGEVYNRAQMKRVVGIDGSTNMEMLNQASLDPQSGNPININDLSQGRFAVDVEVGPQYESQKEATIESIERILSTIQSDNPYFGPLLAMWMENISGTGLGPLKEFNRQLMLRQGLVEPETPEEEAQLQQLAQQTDPQQDLIEAATNQQNAEAQNLQASSVQKMADAQLKKAQAAEKVVDIGIKRTEQTLRRLVGVQTGANGAL
jgi:hypothetical protein